MNLAEMDYYQCISKKLDGCLTVRQISNQALVGMCRKNGDEISEASIQRIRKYHEQGKINTISIYHVFAICKALGIEESKLLDPNASILADGNIAEFGNFISQASNRVFRGYLGKYNAYFYPTKGDEGELIRGELYLSESPFGQCQAKFRIFTKRFLNGVKDEVIKEYIGNMVISLNMSACYLVLRSEKNGEISFMTFRYMHMNEYELVCRIALALTTSAGENRRPTAHRILLTRKDLSEQELDLLRSQLLMNAEKIVIDREELNQIIDQFGCKPEEKQRFFSVIRPNHYCVFDESLFNEMFFDEVKKKELICKVRNASLSARYNKVSDKADGMLYSFLCEQAEEISL